MYILSILTKGRIKELDYGCTAPACVSHYASGERKGQLGDLFKCCFCILVTLYNLLSKSQDEKQKELYVAPFSYCALSQYRSVHRLEDLLLGLPLYVYNNVMLVCFGFFGLLYGQVIQNIFLSTLELLTLSSSDWLFYGYELVSVSLSDL